MIISLFFYFYNRNLNNSTASNLVSSGQTQTKNTPQVSENELINQHKEELAKQDSQQKKDTGLGQKTQIGVVITAATNEHIYAYITGVMEEGGTCTATLTKDHQVITKTSIGFTNVSTTNCAPIQTMLTDGGKWELTLEYSSSTAQGKAQATIEVP